MATDKTTTLKLQMIFLGSIACCVFAFGLYHLVGIVRSPRLTVDGQICGLHLVRGKGTRSYFYLQDSGGNLTREMATDYTGPNLFDGEWAEIEYLAFNGTVINVRTFTSSNSIAWSLHEGDGSIPWFFMCLYGPAIFVISLNRFRNPTQKSDSTPPNFASY